MFISPCLLVFQNNRFSGSNATEIVPGVTQREPGAERVLWERERKGRRETARQEADGKAGGLSVSEITRVDVCYMLIGQYCLLEVTYIGNFLCNL